MQVIVHHISDAQIIQLGALITVKFVMESMTVLYLLVVILLMKVEGHLVFTVSCLLCTSLSTV